VCWKPCSSCWSLYLLQEEFLSAPIHSPLWFAVSVLQVPALLRHFWRCPSPWFPRCFLCSLAFIHLLMSLPCFVWSPNFVFYLFSLQALRSNLIIPVYDKPGLAFLGPMGDIDPMRWLILKLAEYLLSTPLWIWPIGILALGLGQAMSKAEKLVPQGLCEEQRILGAIQDQSMHHFIFVWDIPKWISSDSCLLFLVWCD
jgi:hypothetical protein